MFTKRQIFGILTGLCFLVYFNSLNGAFISDDITAILKEPKMLNLSNWLLSPSEFFHSLFFIVFKANPIPFHLLNIILHVFNTIMVFYFLRMFFKTEASFLGSALFAVLPIHVEAVTWISGSSYLVICTFVLATYFLYRRATYPGNRPGGFDAYPYTAALLIFVYFISTQISWYALTVPLLIFSDITFRRWRANWKWWIPFIAIVAGRLLLARATIVNRIESVAKELGVGKGIWDMQNWSNPIYNMSYSFFEHLRLLVWPHQLTLYHEPPTITRIMLNIELVVLGLVLIAAPFIFKKAKPIFFGLGIYVIFFIPSYSPVLISWLVAERYAYIPSIGFCTGLCFAYEKLVRDDPGRRKVAFTVAVFLITCYGVRTVIRNEDWKTTQRMWRSTSEVSFLSPRAHNNMGDAYAQEENFSGAIKEFKRAIELKPDYADAYHNLANINQHIGNLPEAIANYEKALSFNPALFESNYNLAVAYINTDQPDKAIALLNRAFTFWPDNPDLAMALTFAVKKKNGT